MVSFGKLGWSQSSDSLYKHIFDSLSLPTEKLVLLRAKDKGKYRIDYKMVLLKSLESKLDTGNPQIFREYLITKSVLSLKSGNLEEAIQCYHQLFNNQLLTTPKDSAIFLIRMRDHYASLYAFGKAVEIENQLRQMEPRVSKQDSTYRIKWTPKHPSFVKLGLYQRAIDELRPNVFKQLRGSKKFSFNRSTILARLYGWMGKTDSAMLLYNKVENRLIDYRENGDRFPNNWFGRVYLGKGEVLNSLHKYKEASLWLEKSIKIYEKTNVKRADVFLANAEAQLGMGDLSQAKKYMQQTGKLIAIEKNDLLKSKYYRLMAQYHEEINDPVQALFWLKKSYDFKDSLELEKTKTQSKGNELLYSMNQLEKDLIASNAQVDLEKEKLSNQRSQRNFLFLFLGLVLLFVVYLIRSNQLKRKREIELIEQNIEIEAQKERIDDALDEKKMLLKEIHHRVKNNLQVVSGILKLHSRQFKNTQFSKAMEDGRNRIKVMTAVHQMLYKSEDLNRIEIGPFIEELITNLKILHASQFEHLSIHSNTGKHTFSIDLAVTLGLLVNEILSNAFKHAFPERKEDASLWVSLKKSHGGSFSLVIRDNGIGMDESKLSHQTLGWSLIRGLVQQLDGSYTLESKEGTTFTLVFKENDE